MGVDKMLVLNCQKMLEINCHFLLESTCRLHLDTFIEENHIPYVSYIKADIEGAERQMLKGAKKILKEYTPKLSICTYHYDDDPQVLEAIIKEANPNYIVKHAFKKLYAYCPR